MKERLNRGVLKSLLGVFEKRFSVSLPEDYEQYLLAGSPWKEHWHTINVSRFPSYKKSGEEWITVDRPYQLCGKGTASEGSLFEINEVVKGRQLGAGVMPAHSIVIAAANTDNIILFVSGTRIGQVWLKGWFALSEYGADNPEDDLYLLSKSFRQFMELVSESERQ